MSEPNVVLTLRRKRDDIENAIVGYEKRLEQNQVGWNRMIPSNLMTLLGSEELEHVRSRRTCSRGGKA